MDESGAEAGKKKDSTRRGAYLVAAGIFLSRIAGLVRERAFAHYFGNSDAADAFKAALKIPNFLQNLFGEGVLSASFIPVYAGLIARERSEEAKKLAGIIASLLALVASILVLIGIISTPFLIDAVAYGFEGEKRLLAIRLVEIFFPGAGLLVMSAWCLGILNSHRRFFLSYVAPVLWNAAIIGSLILFGDRRNQFDLAVIAAWGAVAGSALQFAVQLPTAYSLLKGFHFGFSLKLESVREVVRNFLPVVMGRGVVQISAYVDVFLAGLLPAGSVAALSYAQTLYLLPVSLFGMSVSASELPAMSSATGSSEEISNYLRERLDAGLRQIAFYIVPSAMGFFALGDAISGALYQSGQFARSDTVYVWGVLAASTLGLPAATLGRLYASTFYSLHDTRTPLRFAIARVILSVVLGFIFAFEGPGWFDVEMKWGVAGLAVASAAAAWVEYMLLRRSLNRRIGRTNLDFAYSMKLWGAASAAAAAGWAVKTIVGDLHPIATAIASLAPYGLIYLTATWAMGIPEAKGLIKRIRR